MRLPVANSQPVDFILPAGGMLAAFLPGRWRILNSVTPTWQGLASILEGLLKLRPSRDPTCSRAVGWAIESVVPKRGRSVPLWYLTQNMLHGEDAGFLSSPIIPKRFRCSVPMNSSSNYLAVKSLISVLELQMQHSRHSNCIEQRKGTPYHDRRSLRPYSLVSRYVRRTREPRNATGAA
jgi:hypothetical protein